MEEVKTTGIFEQKFDLWNKKLLDLSRRNRLLNYKVRKAGTYKLDGDIEELFDKLVNGNGFVYKNSSNSQEDEFIRSRNRKLEYIRKQIKEAEDELGFNIGYAAFGMLEWGESNYFDKKLESPLVLVPIKIVRENLSSPIEITIKNDEDIVVNPVISKKLFDDFGVNIDSYNDFSQIKDALDYFKRQISDFDWTIHETIVIDTFNFQNLVIQKDLERNKDSLRNNPFIKAISGEQTDEVVQLFEGYNKEINLRKEPSVSRLQILDADSSQQEAISRARRGDSFVLQGPPGTGKSQTITNIIAEQLGMGRKVLFVSEKQAALDVVYKKLQHQGLSDFVLTLHNTKQKKGEIRNQLQSALLLSEKSYKFKDENLYLYSRLDEEVRDLDDYVDILHNANNKTQSIYYLQGKLSSVITADDLLFEVDESILELSHDEMERLLQMITKFAKLYITDSTRYNNNPWKNYEGELSFTKITELSTLCKDIIQLRNLSLNLNQRISCIVSNSFNSTEMRAGFHLLQKLMVEKNGSYSSRWITLNIEDIRLDILELKKLLNQQQNLIMSRNDNENEIREIFDEEFLRTENIEQHIKVLKYEYNSPFKRLFSTTYKEIFRKNKLLTKELKLDYEQLIYNFEKLSKIKSSDIELDNLNIKINEIKNRINEKLGKSYNYTGEMINNILNGVSWLLEIKQAFYKDDKWIISVEELQELIAGEKDVNWLELENLVSSFLDNEYRMDVLLQEFYELFPSINRDIDDIIYFIQELDFSKRDEFFAYKKIKNELLDTYKLSDFISKLERQPILSHLIYPIFLKRYLLLVLEKNPNYKKINQLSSKEIDERIENFKSHDKSTFSMARDRIFKYLVDRLPSVNDSIRISGGEIAVLKKEIAKKVRLMSTRKLIQSLPNLLPRLKPCIMMSPLTVSTYFSSTENWQFDLVIFDEASQVKTEYAVAAISRGKQIIVAGDSKQMPPTSFFDSYNDEGDLKDDEIDIEDLESILDELSVKIPETYLNWHYRSKDESLIAFSNKKFYNNRLYTFPTDNSDIHSNVQFTFTPDGVWESKLGNSIEADKVIEVIKNIAINYPNKSVGVVAFGMSQARVIEDKLFKFREENPELEAFFDESKHEPFFVKNLENVQGDERDIVILSVGYGKNPDGKLRMNFGPLTKSGGERRLNVAVSRARETMHVISSIRGVDIPIEETTNENRIIFRDFLEFAEKGIPALLGYEEHEEQKSPEFDSDFEENVYNFLVTKGYKVHTQVGASGYRIDMAILHPNIPGRYVLAIECDGAAYHSSKTARDRDRLRQEILESKGWNFYRIWSTSWIHDNVNEKNKLVNAIEKLIENYSMLSDDIVIENEETIPSNLITVTDSKVGDNLPRYNGDVYDFEENLYELSNIIMLVASRFVGYNVKDLMRYINKEVFGKLRLTKGYIDVYSSAFRLLIAHDRIVIKGGIIESVTR
jgi:helicase